MSVSDNAVDAAVKSGEEGMWKRAHASTDIPHDAPTTRELFTACVEAAYPTIRADIIAELAAQLRMKAEAADKEPRTIWLKGYVRGTYEAAGFIEALGTE